MESISVTEIVQRLEQIIQDTEIHPTSNFWALQELLNDIVDNTFVTEVIE